MDKCLILECGTLEVLQERINDNLDKGWFLERVDSYVLGNGMMNFYAILVAYKAYVGQTQIDPKFCGGNE